ncbi:MAG: hypothetical protein OEM38_05045, partial [Gammaproteobacteria bacterium]|nr:hypothetical protein [Gammaproteobacteria bacterium]
MEFLICSIKNIQPSYKFRKCAKVFGLLGILLTFFFSSSAFSAIYHDQSLNWQTLNSKHFELHFHDDEQELAEKSIDIAEKVLQELQSTFNWIPKEKIEIILTDEFDSSNGFVIAPFLPSLRITLYPTAPDNISEVDDWLELLITHELTHAIHIDKASGNALVIRKLFGRHPLSFPNIMQPSWILEGLATYLETDEIRGIGRGQDDIFGMMMRMEVKKGIKSFEEVNLDTSNWPIGTTRYLYGVHFFQFLESHYSKASIIRFIDQYSNNTLPFALNENSVLVYGKTMPELWEEFEEYLNKKYLPQLAKISKTTMTQGEQITKTGYFKSFVQPLENGNLLYAQYDGKTPPSLLIHKPEIDETEFIAEVQNEARIDYHPEAGVIVSQMEIYRNTNYLYDLFKINLADDKQLTRLTRGERYRRGIWSPDGEKIVALYNKNAKHTLALLNNDGRLIDLVWEGAYGEYIADLDWSLDGDHLIASVKRGSGSWNIEEFSLEKRTWKKIVASNENEVQPQYSDDGSRIFYSANYNHVYNIYEYHRKSGKINAISNVEGGAFKPVQDNNNHLFYIGYTPKGYDIFKIENKTIKRNIRLSKSKRKTSKDIEPASFEQYNYSSFSNLTPTWWTPSFAFGSDISLIGGYFTGSDALNIHSYDVNLAFDLESNTVSSELNYSYDGWFPLLQTHLSSINRKYSSQEIVNLEFLAPMLQRYKRWYFGMAIRNENQKYSDEMRFSEDYKDYLVGLGAIYDSRKTNIISSGPSKGRLFTLTAETSELFGSDYNGKMVIGKWQEYITLKPEHVLAIRFITGIGLEQPWKFVLGGFFSDGNYYSVNPFSTTPFKTTLYNQRRYSLRGYSESP